MNNPRYVPRQEEQDPLTLGLPKPPDYVCYRTNGPLTIDGRLDEDAWAKAPWLGPFVDMEKGTPVEYDTRVAFLWDDDNFYCGFKCQEPDVFGYETKRDGGVGGDQDFEVFIDDDDTILLRRISRPPNHGLVDHLLACPAPFTVPPRAKDSSSPIDL